MLKKLFTTLFACIFAMSVLFSFSACKENSNNQEEGFNTVLLEEYISEYCKQFPFSGVIRVTEKDKVLYEKSVGFADYENEKPFSNQSMFTLYSLSKPFCAIGLLKLYDQGLVDLNANPSKYVPEMDGFHEELTVRHLLHHISGLPDFEQDLEYKEQYYNVDLPIREELKLLNKLLGGSTPGRATRYANINFIVCALIIENVSQSPYAEYMKEEVFKPLGMQTATVDERGLSIENRVQGYGFENDKFIPVGKAYRWMMGAGDIVGTVDDVYRLNVAIKNKLLLKEETWEQVLTPSKINSYGMGCRITEWHGKKRITHNGGHDGFRTLHIQLPSEDFDIILLSNYGGGNARDDFAEAIYAARYGLDEAEQSSIDMDAGYIEETLSDKEKAQKLFYNIFIKK